MRSHVDGLGGVRLADQFADEAELRHSAKHYLQRALQLDPKNEVARYYFNQVSSTAS